MTKTTIVAQATAMVAQPIGIIRLSGPLSLKIASRIIKKHKVKARTAHFVQLYDNGVIDHAVMLAFGCVRNPGVSSSSICCCP